MDLFGGCTTSPEALPEEDVVATEEAPLGAQGWITTRPNAGVRWIAVDIDPESPSTPRVEEDRITGLRYIRIPGIVLVAADNTETIPQAVRFLRAKMRTPADQGVIVLPAELSAQLDAAFARELASNGIVLADTTTGLNDALIAYATEFIQQGADALDDIEAFMANDD